MRQEQKKKPKKSSYQLFDRQAITWQSPELKDTLNQIDENQKRKSIKSAYQYYSSREFVSKTMSDLFQGIKPHANSAEILKALRDNPDRVGELFKIVDRGLSKFVKEYKLGWNDDKRLLSFLRFFKFFCNNPNMFNKPPEAIANIYRDLDLPFPNANSFLSDEAPFIVNTILEITEVPVISAVRAKKKVEKEMAKFRRGSKLKNACYYLSALHLALQENISVRSAMDKQEDLEEEERLKKYNSLSNVFYKHGWSLKSRKDIKEATRYFEKECASKKSSIS